MKRIVLDEALIRHLLELSNLWIDESEYERFKGQLQKILDYFIMLNEVDTEGVTPQYGGIECPPSLRLDIPKESLSRMSAIQNAPAQKEGLFEIPKVIE